MIYALLIFIFISTIEGIVIYLLIGKSSKSEEQIRNDVHKEILVKQKNDIEKDIENNNQKLKDIAEGKIEKNITDIPNIDDILDGRN